MRVLLVALLMLAFAFAGCTDDGSDGSGENGGDTGGDDPGSSADEGETHVVEVSNFQFSPSTLTVQVGDTVEFQFMEGTHTATSDDGGATFDSGTKSSGTYSWTPEEAGSVPFLCEIHPDLMTGTITVE